MLPFLVETIASWGIAKIADKVFEKNIASELDGAIKTWLNSIEEDKRPGLNVAINQFRILLESNESEAKKIIQKKINCKTIPKKIEWENAFIEQWKIIRSSRPLDELHSFFSLLSENDVSKLFKQLAERFEKVYQGDEKYAFPQIFEEFKNIDNKQTQIQDAIKDGILENSKSHASIQETLKTVVQKIHDLSKDVPNLTEQLDKIRQLRGDRKHEEAIIITDEFAKIAREKPDEKELAKALMCKIEILHDLLVSRQSDEVETTKILARIEMVRDEFQKIDNPNDERNIEKALHALRTKEPNDALNFAKIVENETDNSEIKAQALLIQLQANWQLNTPEMGLILKDRVQSLAGELETEALLALSGTWLMTLRRAKRATKEDVEGYLAILQKMVAKKRESCSFLLSYIEDVASGPIENNDEYEIVKTLMLYALNLASNIPDSLRYVTFSLQMAVIAAEFESENEAMTYLNNSERWIDNLKSSGDRTSWFHRKATALAMRGKIKFRLAEKASGTDHLGYLRNSMAAYEELKKAVEFTEKNESEITGDFVGFCADINIQLGDAAVILGRHAEAAEYFRKGRTERIMSDVKLKKLGISAWKKEITSLLHIGKLNEVRAQLREMINSPLVVEAVQNEAKQKIAYIDEHILPVTRWFGSPAAEDIKKVVYTNSGGLRQVIAEQVRPLLEWFGEFPAKNGVGHAYSELFDIWGRGGFSRVVAAIQASPLNTISVDASNIAEIVLWARVFCPLYDVVLVSWKGPLKAGLAIVPMPNSGAFGGQGYLSTSDTLEKQGWHAAVGWGNYLPREISEFLATEALPLLKSGRLVVIPASLVGCTQSDVGWTDNLFSDTLLGGVVKTAKYLPDGEILGAKTLNSRLINLNTLKIPFVDNISLNDLDRILEDATEWLSPLRRLLPATLGSSRLRHEEWDSLRSDFSSINDFFSELDNRWKSLVTPKHEKFGWRKSEIISSFFAAEKQDAYPGTDFITDRLRSITDCNQDLGPWIPFWLLRGAGGQLNWTRPLDNQSRPPNEFARSQGFSDPTSQGWLFPGDGGPGMGTMRNLE